MGVKAIDVSASLRRLGFYVTFKAFLALRHVNIVRHLTKRLQHNSVRKFTAALIACTAASHSADMSLRACEEQGEGSEGIERVVV
jgi:hypothetical protein